MARPIHHFLKEFATGEEAQPAPTPGSSPGLAAGPPKKAPVKAPALKAAPTSAPEPAADVLSSRLQESYQQGVAEGRSQERHEIDRQTAELSIDFERRLEEARSGFSNALAGQVADEVRNGIERARLEISTHVATALLPILRAGVTRAAITSFVAELGEMVELTEGIAIDVACPRELVELVREALGEAMGRRGAPPGSVRCLPGDTIEVRVKVNDTVIETRLADWLSRLDGVLR
jgi:hypothetical protein